MNKAGVKEVSFEIGTATDEGRVGKNNEDAYTVFRAWFQERGESTQAYSVQVAVVADGIGGSVAGEQASRLAVRTIQEMMAEDTASAISQRLEKAIKQANTNLYQAAIREPALKGMGTTVVAAAVVNGALFAAHAGDSRLYLIREHKIHRLTKDHTWAQEAMDAGYLTPQEAAKHPNRNVIKRYLGIHDRVEVDHQILLDQPLLAQNPQPDQLSLRLGDTVLLCSDGLTDVVNDQEILNAIVENRPQKAADKLIGLANKAGGPDNITAVLMHWPDGKPKSSSRWPLWAVAIAGLLLLVGGSIYLGLNNMLKMETGPSQSGAAATETSTPAPAAVSPADPVTATLIPSPTSLAEITVTPSPPAPTLSPAVEEASPTSTLIIPTETPTPELITPIILATPTITSAQLEIISVTLVSPENNTSGGGEQVFSWEINSGTLETGQGFELIFWKEGEDPLHNGFGLAPPTQSTKVQINLDRLDDSSDIPLQPGTYNWGLRLVQLSPYERLKYLGGDHQFRFSR